MNGSEERRTRTQAGPPDLAEVVAVLAGRADAHDRDATLPHAGFVAAFEAGLLTATVPVGHGGGGLGVEAACRLVADLGSGDPSVALVVAMTLTHHALAAAQPGTLWPADLYAEVLRESLGGPVLLNALRVEPALGTPARGGLPDTVARRVAGGWLVSGRKIYSTGSYGLGWLSVYARTDEAQPRVGSFHVRHNAWAGGPAGPPDGPRPLPLGGHVTIEPTWDHLGLRATASHDVVLVDAFVPAGATSPLAPATSPQHVSSGPFAAWSLLVPALYLGVGRAARDWLVAFLHERVPSNLGTSLARLPRFETLVGEIEARLVAAEELLLGLAARFDADPDGAFGPQAVNASGRAGLVKGLATRHLIEAVELAVSATGNPGLSRANPLQRHLRDVLCARVHTPQEDAVISATGRAVLARAQLEEDVPA